MQYRQFEDLPVWKDSAELARRMYEFSSSSQFNRHSGLRDQLERAALSVSNNIAEGFESEEARMSCLPFFTSPAVQPAKFDQY